MTKLSSFPYLIDEQILLFVFEDPDGRAPEEILHKLHSLLKHIHFHLLLRLYLSMPPLTCFLDAV